MFCLFIRPPPTSPLFPYTTLFRSRKAERTCQAVLRMLRRAAVESCSARAIRRRRLPAVSHARSSFRRSEEHTSELQSHHDLVCRLLLEKKKAQLIGREPARREPRN